MFSYSKNINYTFVQIIVLSQMVNITCAKFPAADEMAIISTLLIVPSICGSRVVIYLEAVMS